MSLDFARIRVLCFDLDGTISDTDDVYVAELQRWLSPFKFLPESSARRVITALETPGNLFLQFLDYFGIDTILHRMRSRRAIEPRVPTNLKIIPGAKEAIQDLQNHYPITLVSARTVQSVNIFLKYFDLSQYFQLIVGAETTPRMKPYPDPLLLVAEQLNVLPEELLMIGDTTVDILAGKAVGAQTIGVLCGFGTQDELEAAGADIILPSIAHIPVVFSENSDIT
jgi:HAD superfamily hydrolase (TIGR01549 family)